MASQSNWGWKRPLKAISCSPTAANGGTHSSFGCSEPIQANFGHLRPFRTGRAGEVAVSWKSLMPSFSPFQIIPNFYPPLEAHVRQGVFNSLTHIVEKRVLA